MKLGFRMVYRIFIFHTSGIIVQFWPDFALEVSLRNYGFFSSYLLIWVIVLFIKATQVPQCTTTLVLEDLLIFLTCLEGVPLSDPGIFPVPCGVLPSMLDSAEGVPPILSVVPSSVLTPAYGIPQALSIFPHPKLVFDYGLPILGVQPSSVFLA